MIVPQASTWKYKGNYALHLSWATTKSETSTVLSSEKRKKKMYLFVPKRTKTNQFKCYTTFLFLHVASENSLLISILVGLLHVIKMLSFTEL